MKVSKPQPQRKLLAGDVVSPRLRVTHNLKGQQEGVSPFSVARSWTAKTVRTIRPKKR